MELNKKGFTLVEMLAVVVILLAISVIAVSSISASIERNKAKQNAAKKEVIVSYGKLYYQKNKNRLYDKNGGNSGCIPVSDLDLSEDEKAGIDGESFSGGGVKYTDGKNFEYVYSCS